LQTITDSAAGAVSGDVFSMSTYALICSLATAPVMGTTVNQRAAMVVASPSFVVALANDFATIPKMGASLSGFGAMSSSWPQVGCRSCQV